MDEGLDLHVIWPSKRLVKVHVNIEAALRGGEAAPAAARKAEHQGPISDIGPEELESRSALLSFLARITRALGEGETTGATCWEERQHRLYELLEIDGKPTGAVEVRLPKNA